MTVSRALGGEGEELAVRYLKRQGYRIIERNFHCPLGEIDVIARHGGYLVFVEIKSRSSSDFGFPHEAVHYYKQRRIIRAAMVYLARHRLNDNVLARFDVVAIERGPSGAMFDIVQNAFQTG